MTHGKSWRPLWGLSGPRVEDAPASPLTDSAATPTVSFLCIFGLALSSGQFCRKRVIAKLHASSALSPWRMRSTTRKLRRSQSQTCSEGVTSANARRVEKYLRQDRMISSPSPVATAAPTLGREVVKSAKYRHFSLLLMAKSRNPEPICTDITARSQWSPAIRIQSRTNQRRVSNSSWMLVRPFVLTHTAG